MANKAKKTTKKLVFLRPRLLVLAAACAWGAVNQPAVFTPASLGVWAAGALTAALLTAAALSLALPAARLVVGILRDTIIDIQKGFQDK
jgi:hypothetical protein